MKEEGDFEKKWSTGLGPVTDEGGRGSQPNPTLPKREGDETRGGSRILKRGGPERGRRPTREIPP